ncbi:HypC/HybG/HupF family hydrogenase formation chaperone [Virgisporangium aurantiacum]|uniref:Hydrogenase assembly protein HypC n=1 Tax=Virgisporangium aurantiacum TaxID=175570 RepID=A0A8J4DYV1_9ACTN|nr:HypC/HybG/HupF family hydrogenase formation chaperone [Virgisporangium aurantiacum]GIJ54838.1 hydrogenase assembly protein HypC [Virgisporangium aurantiacum]
MCLAVPGRIIRLDTRDDTLMAEVDFGGVRKDVCLEYIPDATIGEYVIVHVGFAIQRLDEESAKRTLENFERMGILEEELGP